MMPTFASLPAVVMRLSSSVVALLLLLLLVHAPSGGVTAQPITKPSGQPTSRPTDHPTSRPSNPTVVPTYFYRAPTPPPTGGTLVVLGATLQVLGLPGFSATNPVPQPAFSNAFSKAIFNGMGLDKYGGSVQVLGITYGMNRRRRDLLLQPMVNVAFTVTCPNSGSFFPSLQVGVERSASNTRCLGRPH